VPDQVRPDPTDDWQQAGFVRRTGLFSPAEATELLAAVRTAHPREPGENLLSSGEMHFASNLFYGSTVLQRCAADPRIVELVTALIGPDLWCRWDQAVCKRPGAGWFPWHQDNGYTRLADAHVQVWVALTVSEPRNGGLLVAPGAHTSVATHEWVGNHVQMAAPDEALEIWAQPGDVIAFSSLLPHATAPNRGDVDRWAYVLEYLPLSAADPSIAAPHFVVARQGRPAPAFVDLTPRWA